MKKRILVFTVFFLILPLLIAHSQNYEGKYIDEVKFEGLENSRIDETEISTILRTERGLYLSMRDVNDDLKDLFETKYFNDIKIDIQPSGENVKVTFKFEVRPLISELSILGNQKIGERRIKRKIEYRDRDVKKDKFYYDEYVAIEIMNKIKEIYQEKGYSNISATHKVFEKEDGVKLEIYINEGNKVFIKEIKFDGNNSFKEAKLKKIMTTKKRQLAGIWKKGILDDTEFKADLGLIRDFYYNEGFIFATVEDGGVELDTNGRRIFVIVKINEGDQYRFGKLEVNVEEPAKDGQVYELNEIIKTFTVKTGDKFSSAKLDETIGSIKDLYGKKGYLNVSVFPKIEYDTENKVGNISFQIKEGSVSYVGKIIVKGNEKTKDYVIERELTIKEGDPFNSDLIQESQRKVYNLNYFKAVFPNPIETKMSDVLDLEWRVQEKETGRFQIGGAYSSEEGLIGSLELGEGNLLGRGYLLNFKYEHSSRRDDYSISFTDPWFLNPWVLKKQLLVGIDLYNLTYDRYELYYEEIKTGVSLRFGHNIGKHYKLFLKFRHEEVKINVEDEDIGRAPSDVLLSVGLHMTNSIFFQVSRDTRDYYYNPTSGSRYAISAEIAGDFIRYKGAYSGFGGDENFGRYIFESSWYFPTFWKFIFDIKLQAGIVKGYANTPVPPIYERFFVGGDYDVRGYEDRSIGITQLSYGRDNWEWGKGTWNNDGEIITREYIINPYTGIYIDPYSGIIIDPATGLDKVINESLLYGVTTYPIGGDRMLYLGLEYKFPVYDRLWGALFFDAGNTWSRIYFDMDGDGKLDEVYAEPMSINNFDLYTSYGLGFMIDVPFFGVLHIDYAWGQNHPTPSEEGKSWDDGRLHFRIGTEF
ncbi:MAG: outer membrane protein assembly factor BamA [bacterium]|nr:outer membrane protein assembly factor BamA [bacterium]